MKFYDATKVWSIPDVFAELTDKDYAAFRIQDTDKRIRFKPILTERNKFADIAFIGLNTYCADDFAKAASKFNYFEWVQEDPEYFKFLKPIMEIYCQALELANNRPAVAYYTNYLKIVPSKSGFGPGKGAAVRKALDNSDKLVPFCKRTMAEEVDMLTAHGCRIFVCFGSDAAELFQEAVSPAPTPVAGVSQLVQFESNDAKCVIVNSPHFAARQDMVAESEFLTGIMFRHGLQGK